MPGVKGSFEQTLISYLGSGLIYVGLVIVYAIIYFHADYQKDQSDSTNDKAVTLPILGVVLGLPVLVVLGVYVCRKWLSAPEARRISTFRPALTTQFFRVDTAASLFVTLFWTTILILGICLCQNVIDSPSFARTLVKLALVMTAARTMMGIWLSLSVLPETQWREALQFELLGYVAFFLEYCSEIQPL
jgi:hypothetical protein